MPCPLEKMVTIQNCVTTYSHPLTAEHNNSKNLIRPITCFYGVQRRGTSRKTYSAVVVFADQKNTNSVPDILMTYTQHWAIACPLLCKNKLVLPEKSNQNTFHIKDNSLHFFVCEITTKQKKCKVHTYK